VNIKLSYNAFLGDWVDDREGGFDLWWELGYFFDASNVSLSVTGARDRAADVWLRVDGGADVRGKWSWTAYHPVTGEVFAAGHQFKTPEEAKARCLEVINDRFCNREHLDVGPCSKCWPVQSSPPR